MRTLKVLLRNFLKTSKSNKGFSLTQAIIMTGAVGGMSASIMHASKRVAKERATLYIRSQVESIHNKISQSLRVPNTCSALFSENSPYPTKITVKGDIHTASSSSPLGSLENQINTNSVATGKPPGLYLSSEPTANNAFKVTFNTPMFDNTVMIERISFEKISGNSTSSLDEVVKMNIFYSGKPSNRETFGARAFPIPIFIRFQFANHLTDPSKRIFKNCRALKINDEISDLGSNTDEELARKDLCNASGGTFLKSNECTYVHGMKQDIVYDICEDVGGTFVVGTAAGYELYDGIGTSDMRLYNDFYCKFIRNSTGVNQFCPTGEYIIGFNADGEMICD